MDGPPVDPENDISDRTLLLQLRNGDADAYTELWRRHVSAALTVARRILPTHAEDLVSESFLAVYHQVTVSGGGPTTSFRAYLFTVIRNTAQRWQRDNERLSLASNIEDIEQLSEVDASDTLDLLSRESTSAELLAAMTSLPERWQRVLWLTEVEEASRRQIAQELGIGTNAVSQLHRRARSGLRMNWLDQQIPHSLRDDQVHVASLLPRLIVDGRANGISKKVNAHLRSCEQCSDVHNELRNSYAHLRKITLSLAGFAALAGTAPAMAPLASAGTAAAIAAFGLAGTAIVASVALVFVSAAARIDPVPVSIAAPTSDQADTTSQDTQREDPGAQDAANGEETGHDRDQSDRAVSLGRNNTDDSISLVAFTENNYVPPVRTPRALPGGNPSGNPGNPDARTPPLSITSVPALRNYLAPTITGTTAPEADVLVEVTRPVSFAGQIVEPETFAASVAADGSWQFSFRELLFEMPGLYRYRVWAHTGQADSAPAQGDFTLLAPEILGLEFSGEYQAIPIDEASSSGLVFQVKGPSGGTVCLDSAYTGQVAEIALDTHGEAIQRLRIPGAGSYFLVFRVCSGEYRSPGVELFIDVEDPEGPIFGGYGPGAALLEVSAP